VASTDGVNTDALPTRAAGGQAERPATPNKRLSEPGDEARTWFQTLSPEKRAAIHELSRVQPIYTLVVGMFAALWMAGAVLILRVPQWPARLAGYLLIGLAIHGLANMLHESIHGNMFRNRRLDYWAGLLTGLPALLGVTAYRVNHLPHHWYNRTERDPSEIMNLSKNKGVLSVLFYVWLVAGMFLMIVTTPITAQKYAKPREKRLIAAEYLTLAAVVAGLVLAGLRFSFLRALFEVWGIPLIVAAMIGNVRGWAEHMLTLPGHPLTQSRTVSSNRLVSLLFVNANYHLEHHLFPGMPWYNLPKLHQLLQDEYKLAGTFKYKSYLRFLWDATLLGVHGLAPKHVRLPAHLTAHGAARS
jgi:fatty acid desaturase